MLMSEQDYADIGLPKEPRIKLLNSMRQLQNRSTAHVPQSPPQQIPLLKHINPQPLWNSAMDNNLHHPESRLPPALRNSVHFPGTPQLAVRHFNQTLCISCRSFPFFCCCSLSLVTITNLILVRCLWLLKAVSRWCIAIFRKFKCDTNDSICPCSLCNFLQNIS